jgi:hypothetical protein
MEIEGLARLVNHHVRAWQDLESGPPASPQGPGPGAPLGSRSAAAIESGHEAVERIDVLIRELYSLRERLVDELGADRDIRNTRIDEMLKERKSES